jgi:predicted Zn-dependent protease
VLLALGMFLPYSRWVVAAAPSLRPVWQLWQLWLLEALLWRLHSDLSGAHAHNTSPTHTPHSHRAAEYEADAIGIHLLAKACWDPDAMISMLQKLQAVEGQQQQGGGRQPELLSTHPLTQVR